VGNPFSLGKINKGEQVLDIGCGAGVDTILAVIIVGPKGSVCGVDIVSQMIARAESNLQIMALKNVKFQQVSGENLPFSDDTFDVVISNGVINLMPEKEAAMSEIIRVLKPAGRLMVDYRCRRLIYNSPTTYPYYLEYGKSTLIAPLKQKF
jgi:ubiquinone/menaquinone biosynthesis C-methylase UbiE